METIALPTLLLLLTASLKHYIGRNHDSKLFIESLCEFPVDVMFLAVSFATTVLVTQSQYKAYSLCWLVLVLFVTVITIGLWRESEKALFNNKVGKLRIILVLNITISALFLVISIVWLVKDESIPPINRILVFESLNNK